MQFFPPCFVLSFNWSIHWNLFLKEFDKYWLYLLLQIYDVISNAGKPCGVKSVCVYGGTSKQPQISALQLGVVRGFIFTFQMIFGLFLIGFI